MLTPGNDFITQTTDTPYLASLESNEGRSIAEENRACNTRQSIKVEDTKKDKMNCEWSFPLPIPQYPYAEVGCVGLLEDVLPTNQCAECTELTITQLYVKQLEQEYIRVACGLLELKPWIEQIWDKLFQLTAILPQDILTYHAI